MSDGPRPPFLNVQRIGRMTGQGLQGSTETYVLDWDGYWWMWTWRWDRVNVRRNLLLQPIPEPASVSELAETKGEQST